MLKSVVPDFNNLSRPVFAVNEDFSVYEHAEDWKAVIKQRVETVEFSFLATRLTKTRDRIGRDAWIEVSVGTLSAFFLKDVGITKMGQEEIFHTLVKKGNLNTLPAIETKFYAHTILSNVKVWTDRENFVMDTIKDALNIYKNLPNVPVGYKGWYELNNKQE